MGSLSQPRREGSQVEGVYMSDGLVDAMKLNTPINIADMKTKDSM